MPPDTPNATSATSLLLAADDLPHVALLDLEGRQARRLLRPFGPRRAAAQQLPGTRTGHDHELELVLHFKLLGHCSGTFLKRIDDPLGGGPRRAQPCPLGDDD